jgi:hypothetical protein
VATSAGSFSMARDSRMMIHPINSRWRMAMRLMSWLSRPEETDYEYVFRRLEIFCKV